MRILWALCGTLVASLLLAPIGFADEPPAKKAKGSESKLTEEDGDRYKVPDTDVEGLVKYIEEIRTFQPESPEQAVLHRREAQRAIQGAAEKIVKLEKDTKSEAYRLAKSIVLGSEIRTLLTASTEERKQYIAQVRDLLEAGEPTQQQASLAMQTASILEGSEPELAAEAFRTFGEVLEKASDKRVASAGKRMAGAARRMQLPGNEMELTGKTVDGKPLDLADLKGKVVLVDFWATWCGPCIAEIPNMKKLYEKYHDDGFEIVGVSLDSDRDDLTAFLEKRELPWTIVHDEANDGQHPAADHYGVFGIPTMILVGRDGKVVSTTARGERLEKLLAEQFGSNAGGGE